MKNNSKLCVLQLGVFGAGPVITVAGPTEVTNEKNHYNSLNFLLCG
jgi:hypothetical protein